MANTPVDIRLHTLEEITNGFSEDLLIGTGGYGNVYKGVHNGELIAVKLLHPVLGLDDELFNNEVGNLLSVQHPNVVRLLAYCHETHSNYVQHNGKTRLCKRIYRVLCFEYLQGGSLDRHLRDQSFAPNWSTRYKIIKGICEGLKFLHSCEPPIFHLDLKPANILLDSSMVPKLADFGLSRLFSGSHTHFTSRVVGTEKYMPPEFIKQGIISPTNDVFSLGVVIKEIMAGSMDSSIFLEMSDDAQFVQEVHTNWKNMIEATSEYLSEELHQVQTCIDTAMSCVEPDRNNRPTIGDVLDILNMTETHISKRQLEVVLPCPTVGPKNTMAKRLETIPAKKKRRSKTMTTEVENITNKRQNFYCMPRDNFNIKAQQVPDRETSSDVDQTIIIGRTEEKQKILSILSQSITEEMVILPIYGIGGIGKTTLAQLVFNDAQFHEYSRVWVHVSQEFDLKKIGNCIISQLTNETSQIADKQMLHNRLGELFAGRSILVILDDLWEEKPYELDKLKDMLMPRLGSKVIIVTTRDEAIASKVSSTVMPYKLEILTDDLCWTIIKQKSYFENRPDKKQLERTGRDIAVKCGGVALAAQSLGYMLRDMMFDQWESVRDSYIWNLSTFEDPSLRNHEVLVSLRLSYSQMPEFLKLCFSYCAIFPKGRIINKCDLIHQWIALGLIGPSRILDSMQLCEMYVTRLLGMSFLEYYRAPLGWQDKDVTLLTMHDLVHDLARAILADQINDKGNAGGNRCLYALLTDCSKPLQLSMSSPANIRALHFLKCSRQELHGDAFSPATCLHVLDLTECFIRNLPDSIGRLKQLRFLRAPWIQGQTIPDCITELSELNYLNLSCSPNILALPESIGDMKALMHLDLSDCVGIRELPKSFMELRQLVHLNLSHCYMSRSDALHGFTKLQYLDNLIKLKYLNLSGCMHIMAPSKIGSLFDSISTLSNLEHLDFSRNKVLSSIPESIGNLRKLHTLDLSGCSELKKLPDSMDQMVSLKVINMKGVRLDESMLSVLNFASLLQFLLHASIFCVVHASSDKCSSNISLLQPTNPDKLALYRLENVKSAVEAQSIKLIDKKEIKKLTLQWTGGAERFVDDKEVLEKLVPPCSVCDLSISGYKSVSIPDWLMGITQYLPNLLKIDLCDFPKCNNLPPLGQLPNLWLLTICRMEGLEEWNIAYTSGEEGANELMFPKLARLTIKQCAKLRLSRIKPSLPRTMSLRIVDCDNMLSSWGESSSHGGASSSSPLTSLIVDDSKLPLHQWGLLRHLPALSSLTITSCSDLTTSSEIIQHLSSLESLCLESLFLHQTLPQWVGELISLKKFEVKFCKGIRYLPDSIRQLSKLEDLIISDCPKLVEWCESEENKIKLDFREEGSIRRSEGFGEGTFEVYIPTVGSQCSLRPDGLDEGTYRVYSLNIHFAVNNNKRVKAMDIEDITYLTNMKDVVDILAPSVDGTLNCEVHPDLYGAVMDMPGFTEEALLVALSHLMDNNAQGSAYMGMQEEQRATWLINFLKKQH